MSNEETTKYQEGVQMNHRSARGLRPRGSKPWKKIVVGGTSGILMGAGGALAALTYANRTIGGSAAKPQAVNGDGPAVIADAVDVPADDLEAAGVAVVPESDFLEADVAFVDDNMTFGQAFAAAREQVGPGGVFEWHGAIFNTFYEDEWEAMTAEEKSEFAQQVNVTIGADEIDHDSMFATWGDEEPPMALDDDDDGDGAIAVDSDGEVRILGMGSYDGHAVAVLDVDGDDVADYAVINMDEDFKSYGDDVVVYPDGDIASVEGLDAEVEDLDGDIDDLDCDDLFEI